MNATKEIMNELTLGKKNAFQIATQALEEDLDTATSKGTTMKNLITAINIRMAAVEATVTLETPQETLNDATCHMTKNGLTLMHQEKTIPIKSVQFEIRGIKGLSAATHEEAWKKLQGYFPKATFKMQISQLIQSGKCIDLV